MYGHPVYFAETFIDPGRFRGTCYRAANWKLLGLTTGRGKDSTSKRPNRSLKEVLGYALTPEFRDLLVQLWKKGSAQEFDEAQAGVDFMRGGIFGKLAVCETPI
jgi:hypothetical protein